MINVLFDMDGTLLDSERSICEAVNEIRKDMGLPALAYESIQHVIHITHPTLIARKFFMESRIFPIKATRWDLRNIFLNTMQMQSYSMVCLKCCGLAKRGIIS